MTNKTSILLFILIVFSSLVYSQNGNDSLNNSIGLDYRFGGSNSPNIGVTYRRSLLKSPFVLRANFNIGSIDYQFNNLSYGNDLYIYQTNDSAIPLIGVNSLASRSTSYQRIELGLERNVKIWRFNLIAGADVIVGHSVTNTFDRVVQAELTTVEKNGKIYQQYQAKMDSNSFPFDDLNHLSVRYNYLTVGANLRAGFKIDITKKLFATAFLGYRFQQNILMKESFNYRNDSYKEHIPTKSSNSFFSVNSFSSIGIHYKF